MYGIRLILRGLFALAALGLAFAVVVDMSTVQAVASLASLSGSGKAGGWAAAELGGWIVIAAAAVGGFLCLPRPRLAAKVLALGAAVALAVGAVTIWTNMLVWGAGLGIVAILVLWMRKPRHAVVGSHCPRCGFPTGAADRYCERCGHDLTGQKVVDTPRQAEAGS